MTISIEVIDPDATTSFTQPDESAPEVLFCFGIGGL